MTTKYGIICIMEVLHVHQDGRILYLNGLMQSRKLLTSLKEHDVRRPVPLFTVGDNQFLATVLGECTELIDVTNTGQTISRSRAGPCFAEVCLLTLQCSSFPGFYPSITSLKKLSNFSGFTQRVLAYGQATADGQHNTGLSVVMTAIDVTLWPEDAVADFLEDA